METLSQPSLNAIRSVLKEFAERIDRVAVFGSYATGRARSNSDIDLVLYGRLQPNEIDRLWTLFEDSALPVSVDVVAYEDVRYSPLKRHIDAVARTIFTGAELSGAD